MQGMLACVMELSVALFAKNLLLEENKHAARVAQTPCSGLVKITVGGKKKEVIERCVFLTTKRNVSFAERKILLQSITLTTITKTTHQAI